jgi:hypothetical protein
MLQMFTPIRVRVGLCLLIFTALLFSQQAPENGKPTSSPTGKEDGSIFLQNLSDDIEQVRRSPENWSPIERQAFHDAQLRARDFCMHSDFGSPDARSLLATAQICAFGDKWPEALNAASTFLSLSPEKPLPGLAVVERAQIRLGRVQEAVTTAQRILDIVPFTSEANAILEEAAQSLQYGYPMEALSICGLRQTALLALTRSELKDLNFANLAEVRSLYSSAMLLPVLLHFEAADTEAAHEYNRLKILRADLETREPVVRKYFDDAYPFYPLLGSSLGWTMPRTAVAPHAGTIPGVRLFLIRPPNCRDCKRLVPAFLTFANRKRGRGLHFAVSTVTVTHRESGGKSSAQFALNGVPLSPPMQEQLSTLGCLSKPTLVITINGTHLSRVYYPTVSFFAAGAAFDQLASRI